MRLPVFLLVFPIVLIVGCFSADSRSEHNGPRRESGHTRKADESRDSERPTKPVAPPLAAIPHHPRLIFLETDVERTNQLIRTDPRAGHWYEQIRKRADGLLDAELPTNPPTSGMLKISRQTLTRVTNLAGVYRLSGDERYARRAIREMLAVSRFKNWASSDFLAVAEMTAAVSVGYDWTYEVMSPAERETVSAAIVKNGLQPGLNAYATVEGWTRAKHNWNIVCNGGLIVGALAVSDAQPALANSVLKHAHASLEYGMSCFAPDGGWEEGPTYWNYATRYLAYSLASLKSATGDDWAMLHMPGVSRTGLFRIYTDGPTNEPFNFADCEPQVGNSAQMHWLAGATEHPEYAAFEERISDADPSIFDLLWYRPTNGNAAGSLPTCAHIRGGADLVSLRGRWDDPMTTWIAMKGGSNEAHHGHLDLGTFVLDALGQRWAVALGADDYDLPEYFGELRFSYYRCSTAGQNTITLAGRNQYAFAEAPVVSFHADPQQPSAIIDLTQAYPRVERVRRGVSLIDRSDVLIQDQFELKSEEDVEWTMHTAAQIEIEKGGDVARLRQGGKLVTVRIVSPREARFEVREPDLKRPQNPAPGVKRLMIRTTAPKGQSTIAVLFTPDGSSAKPPKIEALEKWSAK